MDDRAVDAFDAARPTSRMLCIRVVAVPGYFGSTVGAEVSLLVDVAILEIILPGTELDRCPVRVARNLLSLQIVRRDVGHARTIIYSHKCDPLVGRES